jgi:hypothetical protein
VKNVVSPAEGYLHMESVWTVGSWLGFISLNQLVAGAFMGMKTFNYYFRTYPYCLYFYRGTCICETVTAPVTFTNNWIKRFVFSFSKIRKWLTVHIWRAWPARPTVMRRLMNWRLCRRTALTGRYVRFLPLVFVSNMNYHVTGIFMYSCP